MSLAQPNLLNPGRTDERDGFSLNSASPNMTQICINVEEYRLSVCWGLL